MTQEVSQCINYLVKVNPRQLSSVLFQPSGCDTVAVIGAVPFLQLGHGKGFNLIT